MTYNTYQEKNGRDPAIDALLKSDAIVCLQEVSPLRALRIKRALGRRALVSPAKSGLLYLVTVFPATAVVGDRRTVALNGYRGMVPALWSLRRAYDLLRAGERSWVDGLETRIAQVARVAFGGQVFRLLNTHLPHESGLRNPCLNVLNGIVVGYDNIIVAGDFNATLQTPALAKFLLQTGLYPPGNDEPTHDSGRRIDFVFYRDQPLDTIREAGYSVGGEGLSDHRIVTVELRGGIA